MNTGFFSVASLDDIVFEGRNKAYGAYVLRQEYPLRVVKATSISLLTLFLFIMGLVLWGQQTQFTTATESSKIKDRTLTLMPEPILPKPPAEPIVPAPVTAPPTAATKAFREIKIVSDLTPVTANIPEQNSFSHAEPGLVTTAGDLPGTITTVITDEPGTAIGTATESSSPFEVVEKMPEFPDGLAAMYKFIGKHLRYPAEAQSRGLEGNVILTFVVSATGQISDIKILQDIGGGAGEEAKRVVGLMPQWRPGLQHNRAVPVRFTLPVRFRIN
ncbi:energy transducer TonB [Adhaeribacter rhizoryzae]|uniref:TonB family protein n=1 Tax=Adhaeribacter rhizoryzae TaxID=2607907 RepID=A0A5M6DKC6_9BACT|nr:energy transducer TonB [Adhaeribacter rhizoryzae]KAA5546660.1 TonB family protein [Adhaeribacter rhizoryzae]